MEVESDHKTHDMKANIRRVVRVSAIFRPSTSRRSAMHVFSIPDWIVCLRKSISRYVFLRSLFAIKKVVYFFYSQACIR